MSTNFKLESMQALLTPDIREFRMEVTNVDKVPMLLVTKVEDQVGETRYASQIMVFPPVIRIDAGATQFIRLRLKQDAPALQQDVLLRLNLTGVGQMSQGNYLGVGLSQVIPLVVRSASYATGSSVWSDLRWQQHTNQLVVTNTGDRLVRLQPAVTLMPAAEKLTLSRAYLRPHETLTLPISSSNISDVKISPFDSKGLLSKPVSITPR